MSVIPGGATHRSAGHYYRKEGSVWRLYGSDSQWIETACHWHWLEKNADPLAPEWSGEGLPPVGAVCEYKHVHEWQKVEVFAVKPNHNGSETALFTYENGTWCGCAEPSFFRPIRTPEQIAADKRLHEIRNALSTINSKVHFPNDLVRGNILAAAVEAMIDAGYRKFEIVDE